MSRIFAVIVACLGLVLEAGCGGARLVDPYDPLVIGNHISPGPNAKKAKSVVVWSNDSGAGGALISGLQAGGLVVVERAQLQQVFKEQQIRLTHTSDDDADILRVGRLIGADRVVFAEVKSTEFQTSSSSVTKVSYHLSIAVRGVDVETGAIRWAGTAYYPQGCPYREQCLTNLVVVALFSAICPVEAGYLWVEPSAKSVETTTCTKNGKRIKIFEMKEDLATIW